MKTTLAVLFFVLIICLVYLLINVSTIHTEKIIPLGVNYEKKVYNNSVDVDLFVYILTGRYNFYKRKLQRNSGMFDKLPKNVMYKYIMGYKPCPVPVERRANPYTCHGGGPTRAYIRKTRDLDMLLEEEMTEHKDIVFVEMVDYYRALPRKVKLAHKWGLENTKAKWFLKMDDDCYFNYRNILNGIMKYDPNDYIVIGNIAKGLSVPKSGKWAERDYIKKKYPPFPLGSTGHLTSRALVSGIVSRMDELYEYQGEDVSMGIWISEFFSKTKIIKKGNRMGGKSSCNHESWVCGHDLTASDFKKMVLYNNNTIGDS